VYNSPLRFLRKGHGAGVRGACPCLPQLPYKPGDLKGAAAAAPAVLAISRGLTFFEITWQITEVDDSIVIEFNPSAFKHGITEADIRWAFDTVVYDGWFNKGEGVDKDKYLLIGFDRNGNPLEILYNFIDDVSIGVFHAMKCRSIYYHLLQREK